MVIGLMNKHKLKFIISEYTIILIVYFRLHIFDWKSMNRSSHS